MRALISDAKESWQWWKKNEYIEGRKFFDGLEHFTPEVEKDLESRGLQPVVIDRTAPFIRQVNSLISRATGAIKFYPLDDIEEGQKDKYSTDMNELAKWARNKGRFEYAANKVREDAGICGLGVLELHLDNTSHEITGNPSYQRVCPLEIIIDPDASAPNFTDAKRMVRGSIISKDELNARFDKEVSGGVDEIFTQTGEVSDGDDEDVFSGENASDSRLRTKDNVTLYDYQWCEYVGMWVVINFLNDQGYQELVSILPGMGKLVVDYLQKESIKADADYWLLTKEQYNYLKEIVKQLGIKGVRKRVKKYYRAFIVGGDVVSKEEGNFDGFSYEFYTMFYDEKRRCPYGYMRRIKWAQRVANSAFLQFYHSLLASPKPILVMETGAPTEATTVVEAKVANNDGVLWVHDGKMGAWGQLVNGAVPSGFDMPLQIAINGMYQATGLNLEVTGQQEAEMSGVLDMQRTERGFDSMRDVIENYRLFLECMGQKELCMFSDMAKVSPGKVMQVVGESDVEAIKLLSKEDYKNVAVLVQEAPKGFSARQETVKLLLEMLDRQVILPEMMPMILEALVTNADMPADIRGRLLAALKSISEPSEEKQQAAAEEEARQKELENALVSANVTQAQGAYQKDMADVELKKAQALKAMQDAHKTATEVETVPDKTEAETMQILATINKTNVDAAVTANTPIY
jgi:hypothetical protein